VAICDKLALVASIMLDVEDEVDPYSFKAIVGDTRFSQILKGLVLMELFHLKTGGVLPLGIAVPEVQHHGMLVVPCHFVPVLVPGCRPVRTEFSLVNHVNSLESHQSSSSQYYSVLNSTRKYVGKRHHCH